MEVGTRQSVELRLRLGSGERPLSARGQTLVGDRDESRPCRCRGAGATELEPPGLAAVGNRVIDRHARVRVGVEGDVGGRPDAIVQPDGLQGRDLVGGFGLVEPTSSCHSR